MVIPQCETLVNKIYCCGSHQFSLMHCANAEAPTRCYTMLQLFAAEKGKWKMGKLKIYAGPTALRCFDV